MQNIAEIIADLVRAGTDPELVGRVAAAFAENSCIDKQAERRRAADRDRKREKRDYEMSAESAESADDPSPLVPPLSPAPLSPPIIPPTRSEPDGFAEFWEVYPKREFNADRKGALKAFKPAVERAGGKEHILRAAGLYAAHCREKGKVGTEFVKQAKGWLGGDLWREWMPQELPAELASTRVYVVSGTDAMDAWDSHFKRTKGKLAPRDQRGGWWFDTEFPPSQQEQAA